MNQLHGSYALALAACGLGALGLGACSSTQTVSTQVDDAAITTAVKAKLTADPEINPFNIDVDTDEGTVRLSGTVEKPEARVEAERVALNTEGVVGVVNEIRVGGGTGGGGDPCYAPECKCLDGSCNRTCCPPTEN